MITDAELDDLPEDDDEAFVIYDDILRASLARQAQPNSWESERQYVTHVLAFVHTRSIPIDLPDNPPDADEKFYDWYAAFVGKLDYFRRPSV